MILKWFDVKEAGQFGLDMAEFFAQRLSPESIPASDKKSIKKATNVLSKVYGQTQRFGKDNKLNMFKKAKLANAFQWKLFDLGYDKKIVEELTKQLLRYL